MNTQAETENFQNSENRLLCDSIMAQVKVNGFSQAVRAIRRIGGSITRVNIMTQNGRCLAHINDIGNLSTDRLYNIYRHGYWLQLEV